MQEGGIEVTIEFLNPTGIADSQPYNLKFQNKMMIFLS